MVIDTVNNCTGCGCCAVVCPTKCLEMKLNDDGFYRPSMNDLDKCTKCNLCDKICPALNNKFSNNEPKAYSVISKNQEILSTTSSGGACYELSKNALKIKRNGGVYNG